MMFYSCGCKKFALVGKIQLLLPFWSQRQSQHPASLLLSALIQKPVATSAATLKH